jgi:hypothetical protein
MNWKDKFRNASLLIVMCGSCQFNTDTNTNVTADVSAMTDQLLFSVRQQPCRSPVMVCTNPYYPVRQNLHGRIKAQAARQGTRCRFDHFCTRTGSRSRNLTVCAPRNRHANLKVGRAANGWTCSGTQHTGHGTYHRSQERNWCDLRHDQCWRQWQHNRIRRSNGDRGTIW